MAKVTAALESDQALTSALRALLAAEVHRTRMRAEMLSLKSVAMRVDTWMVFNDGVLPPK